eukprot:CAMPEP_0116931396 /NCGR_PEP_ID=MMETSP0467-20121206/27790_1 /TAXON_ID=283647 /ORGANISM="Mesodinium pulex, Strain SPMC105" /LENGTH=118 /DNA_ID=CAMNT_0004611825 /DNA_START=387 /DNA_END=743 /DNA_ORIENTATION=-
MSNQNKDLKEDKSKFDQCEVIKNKIGELRSELKELKETRLVLEREMQSNHKQLTELNDRIRQSKKAMKENKKEERKALDIGEEDITELKTQIATLKKMNDEDEKKYNKNIKNQEKQIE